MDTKSRVTRDVARRKDYFRGESKSIPSDWHKAIIDAAYNLATGKVRNNPYGLLIEIAACASILAERLEVVK